MIEELSSMCSLNSGWLRQLTDFGPLLSSGFGIENAKLTSLARIPFPNALLRIEFPQTWFMFCEFNGPTRAP